MNHTKKQKAPVCLKALVRFLSSEGGKKEGKRPKDKKKEKKLGDLILQTARQTLVAWAKEGQLLCIPDKVETSASGENKHELYVAPVCCWQIKPPACGDASTSGFGECWCCDGSDTTFPYNLFAFRPNIF